MDNAEVTAYVESKTNGVQTIELAVESNESEVVEVSITKIEGQEQMTVEVTAANTDKQPGTFKQNN
jgi:hypothetical protein